MSATSIAYMYNFPDRRLWACQGIWIPVEAVHSHCGHPLVPSTRTSSGHQGNAHHTELNIHCTKGLDFFSLYDISLSFRLFTGFNLCIDEQNKATTCTYCIFLDIRWKICICVWNTVVMNCGYRNVLAGYLEFIISWVIL